MINVAYSINITRSYVLKPTITPDVYSGGVLPFRLIPFRLIPIWPKSDFAYIPIEFA